ncbi:NucA/NucB deoxyribonuclease domain-containing protein [Goodfellowiella coeruleoviolacea]|uniref:NucA/NucB deoxyribonuclease domain-containing protein n=1 Tax=Goodfellowiella coeruleoviolacea TaxID=334858 RepID=UPI0020A55FFB|nr:NucA/NucB deoxyribonuclease domain-containing protein [Goodfellowiella coeruleoviolacea]
MITVALVVVFGANKVIDTATGLIDGLLGGGTERISDGNTSVLVASSAKSTATQCASQHLIQNKMCGDTKVVVMDAAKMPFITRNMSLAWSEGKPGILTRNKAAERANRSAACPPGKYPQTAPDKNSCEEYPFASTSEGGSGARTANVPLRENSCQGGTLRWAYASIAEGEEFLVVIANPDDIADQEFSGVDIAKDRACGS